VTAASTGCAGRVTCVISSLAAGGAERVLVSLAADWTQAGRAVTVVTLSDRTSDFYSLSAGVGRVALGMLRATRHPADALLATGIRALALRRAVRRSRPDIVLAFGDQTNVLTLLATIGGAVPVVVAERSSAEHQRLGWPWEPLRRGLYPRAAAVVVQTEGAAAYLRGWGLSPTVIPNAVAHPVLTPARFGGRAPVVLAIGRMTGEKGFDVLLRAFARTRDEHPEWTLRIVGDGPLRGELEALRSSLDLSSELVQLPGRLADIGVEYSRASIFVLSSRYEGFPNVLCEAMAHGCAVLATRSPHGATDIVRSGVDGVLVPVDDVEAMANGLRRLMHDAPTREALGAAAAMLPTRLAPERIGRRWLQLLDESARGAR
jgi:GalNAc-alpha-(1->4)-GalNAc-alpha-(1->3)-diNAcBac-PP-undecaprenol alpha-1,4-N-acetyl-D-galactosaminyltransferase